MQYSLLELSLLPLLYLLHHWLWDRIRVNKMLPDINVVKEPALEQRISPGWGRRGADGNTKEEMRNALRYSINWVSGPPVLDLVPWKTEPERSINEKNRQNQPLATFAD